MDYVASILALNMSLLEYLSFLWGRGRSMCLFIFMSCSPYHMTGPYLFIFLACHIMSIHASHSCVWPVWENSVNISLSFAFSPLDYIFVRPSHSILHSSYFSFIFSLSFYLSVSFGIISSAPFHGLPTLFSALSSMFFTSLLSYTF